MVTRGYTQTVYAATHGRLAYGVSVERESAAADRTQRQTEHSAMKYFVLCGLANPYIMTRGTFPENFSLPGLDKI